MLDNQSDAGKDMEMNDPIAFHRHDRAYIHVSEQYG